MQIFQSHPSLRWLVPVVAVGVVGGTSLIAVSASADPALPDQTPQQLLVDVQKADVKSFSGTVVQKSDLGLPELPGVGGGSYDTSLTSLISGTHTLQVWAAGEDKQRLAIHGTLGETDLIRNGSDVWNWSSQDNAATHTSITGELKQAGPKQAGPKPTDLPKTPQEAAEKFLDAVEPTTSVSTDRAVEVAGRPAYALVLEPKDSGSLIAQVRIAVDGEKKVPLSVQVIATDGTTVFDTSFSSIDFATPDDAYFTFNPPSGTKVTEEKVDADKAGARDKAQQKVQQKARDKAADQRPEIVGKGWSSVVVAKADLTGTGEKSDQSKDDGAQFEQILSALPKVSGSWGSGRLLSGKAFSAVITDDGRIAAGAVAPERLYEALS